MSKKYLYDETPTEVKPAAGTTGALIRALDGALMFRVYHDDERFTDYEWRFTVSAKSISSTIVHRCWD